jgi:hypothetical protein
VGEDGSLALLERREGKLRTVTIRETWRRRGELMLEILFDGAVVEIRVQLLHKRRLGERESRRGREEDRRMVESRGREGPWHSGRRRSLGHSIPIQSSGLGYRVYT